MPGPRTVADAFADAVRVFIREVRAEVHATEQAIADQQRRLNNLLRLEAELSKPTTRKVA